jgi:hypothetical protein
MARNRVLTGTAQDFGPEKRVDAVVHVSRMGIIVLDRKNFEVLDRLAINMIRR